MLFMANCPRIARERMTMSDTPEDGHLFELTARIVAAHVGHNEVAPDALPALIRRVLKRHLVASYGPAPAHYRKQWNPPSDYPMVAADYAEHRSTLARNIGLGRKPKAPEPPSSPRKGIRPIAQACCDRMKPRQRRGSSWSASRLITIS